MNDLTLAIVNDGSGSICGVAYEGRKTKALYNHSISSWFYMAHEAYQRVYKGQEDKPDRRIILETALETYDYYQQHVKEMKNNG